MTGLLNQWVDDGRKFHENKRKKCAFCDQNIDPGRWKILTMHFDVESKTLGEDIDSAITKIDNEIERVKNSCPINNNVFYPNFHEELDIIKEKLKIAINEYTESLNSLATQLKDRKLKIMKPISFITPEDKSGNFATIWDLYIDVQRKSNKLSESLNTNQANAKETLRLNEVANFLLDIQYEDTLKKIEKLEERKIEKSEAAINIQSKITKIDDEIDRNNNMLGSEDRGAKRVNDYLSILAGGNLLSLESIENVDTETDKEEYRFEVMRGGEKAYYLSEGERSLLAFCYFMAKLDDTATNKFKPIIWIDDPISSLDSNHMFFVYSLIKSKIVIRGHFEQLFISTHNLNFLSYLKRLNGPTPSDVGKVRPNKYSRNFFLIDRHHKSSTIQLMPKYIKDHVTEFNFLFHQILLCSKISIPNDSNQSILYNFPNNARKFLETYLYYRYPDKGMTVENLNKFFGENNALAISIDGINNEFSHLNGRIERGANPLVVPEVTDAAKKIIEALKKNNEEQYFAFLNSVDEEDDNPNSCADASKDIQ